MDKLPSSGRCCLTGCRFLKTLDFVPATRPAPSGGRNGGYSPVVASGRGVRVELARDHPGYADAVYRTRRDAIAACSAAWRPGYPVPAVDYTAAEDEVWRIVCAQLAPKHEQYATAEFLNAKARLALPADRAPQLDEVSAGLGLLTGFRLLPVAGLAPLRTFYRAFSKRVFYSTQYLRHPSSPLYTCLLYTSPSPRD